MIVTHDADRSVAAADVRSVLARHVLVDGFPLVLDLENSAGSELVDAVTGDTYLDFFSFFASAPFGLNPPVLSDEFIHEAGRLAVNKPSNPDVYTTVYATFVREFARVLGNSRLPHLFFVDGGALAVENMLKAAFDWKARRENLTDAQAQQLSVLHLSHAFHGRSGYTLSLTNTETNKTDLFPRFAWPRITSPDLRFPLAEYVVDNRRREDLALAMAEEAFDEAGGRIACFVAEPIQGEGGDRHLSARFLQGMEVLCRKYDALFALDEVQTGFGLTGTSWAYEQLGLRPDLVAFGKKTQVCGVMAGERLDEIDDHVFAVSSRISSTWGGNLVDMARAIRFLREFEGGEVLEAVQRRGELLQRGLERIARSQPALLSNARGRGLMCAVDAIDRKTRDLILTRLLGEHRMIALPCGDRSIRFRPALTITEAQIMRGLDALEATVTTWTSAEARRDLAEATTR